MSPGLINIKVVGSGDQEVHFRVTKIDVHPTNVRQVFDLRVHKVATCRRVHVLFAVGRVVRKVGDSRVQELASLLRGPNHRDHMLTGLQSGSEPSTFELLVIAQNCGVHPTREA